MRSIKQKFTAVSFIWIVVMVIFFVKYTRIPATPTTQSGDVSNSGDIRAAQIQNNFSSKRVASLTTDIDELAKMGNSCGFIMAKIETNPKICLIPNDDISNWFSIGEAWELEETATLLAHLSFLKSKSDASKVQFVDIGSNIGAQTLPALSLGFPTISVEGAQSTMQYLATSVKLNNFTANSKLIQKAVSNERGCSHMTDESPGTRKVIVEPCASSDKHDDPKLLPMVTLDDIASELLLHKNLEIVMKMDIEGHEMHAILGGTKLFKTKSVKFFMIEFVHCKNKARQNEEYALMFNKALDYLVNQCGYEAYSFPEGQKLDLKDSLSWPNQSCDENYLQSFCINVVFAQPGFWKGSVSSFDKFREFEKKLERP